MVRAAAAATVCHLRGIVLDDVIAGAQLPVKVALNGPLHRHEGLQVDQGGLTEALLRAGLRTLAASAGERAIAESQGRKAALAPANRWKS